MKNKKKRFTQKRYIHIEHGKLIYIYNVCMSRRLPQTLHTTTTYKIHIDVKQANKHTT